MGSAQSHDTHIFRTLFAYTKILNQFKTSSIENARPQLNKLVLEESNKILSSDILNQKIFNIDGRPLTPLELIEFLFNKLINDIQKTASISKDEIFKNLAREYIEALNNSYLGAIHSVVNKSSRIASQNKIAVHFTVMNNIKMLVRNRAPVSAMRDFLEKTFGLNQHKFKINETVKRFQNNKVETKDKIEQPVNENQNQNPANAAMSQLAKLIEPAMFPQPEPEVDKVDKPEELTETEETRNSPLKTD